MLHGGGVCGQLLNIPGKERGATGKTQKCDLNTEPEKCSPYNHRLSGHISME